MPRYLSIAVCVLCLLAGHAKAFVNIGPRRGMCTAVDRIGSSNNGGDIFFDDFGDGFYDGGSSSSSSSNNNLSSLQSRMSQVKEAEASYDAKLARNWRRGNWSVRGFALDKSAYSPRTNAPTAGATDSPVHVSAVAAPPPSSSTDISLPQDRALPQDLTVAVGRTDGAVFVVKLGDDYLTSFVSVENQWVDSNDLESGLHNERPQVSEFPTDEEGDKVSNQQLSPFEIRCQFLASEQGASISNLVYLDEVEGNDCGGIVCTAAAGSGDICIWKLPSFDPSQTCEAVQTNLLSGVHADEIVSLKTMVIRSPYKELSALFSASRDGTFALWNLSNGELLLSCQCADAESGDTVSLTCADVYNPSSLNDDFDGNQNESDAIFIGTSTGYVMGYLVEELLGNTLSTCPVPNLRFRAHGMDRDSGSAEAITAIKCGGDGTILRGRDESRSSGGGRNPRLSSSILLTGGEDGSVKQWEILSQKTPTSTRMEHWPRLATQRMKRRAHVFTPSHDGPVACIAQQSMYDTSTFLTSGHDDGSVCVWSASSGKELYRMEGFSTVSSLAFLGRELLVTDGMEGNVCIHDFGIAEDAADQGYDLEW